MVGTCPAATWLRVGGLHIGQGIASWSITQGLNIEILSIRIEDHKTERVADCSGIQMTGNGGGWLAFDPDGNPLTLRDASLNWLAYCRGVHFTYFLKTDAK